MTNSRIIVAIDSYDLEHATAMLGELDPSLCKIKIGSVAFNALGKNFLHLVSERGFKIFLDLKFHDIPNTVYETIIGFGDCDIEMLTVHLSGGRSMLIKAMEAANKINSKVIGVSVLTSLNNSDSEQIFSTSVHRQAARLFHLAEKSQIDGVVCSPLELDLAKTILNNASIRITPGIRNQSQDDDQSRTMNAREAINAGASYLVIGRPITQAPIIRVALQDILESLNE